METTPLAYRLAYTADLESTFTPIFKVMLDHEDVLFRPGDERVASLLPPVHVAIVERQQIVADLIDAFSALTRGKEELPSNVVLITGPSKTGDIELQLTTGVHGPGTWHVIVVR